MSKPLEEATASNKPLDGVIAYVEVCELLLVYNST